MNYKNILGALAVAAMGLSLAACGKTVDPGNTGVMVRQYGANAGVDPSPYPNGWHMTGIGEKIVEFPTTERSYAYTRVPNHASGGSDGNEEINFSDHTGLPMTADVQIVLRVDPNKVPSLYKTWRLTFDQLFETPIRNDVRAAIASETELIPVDQLYSGGRQAAIQRALIRVQAKWAPQGVIISQMDWLGNIRYPESVLSGITAKSNVEQATLAAQGRVAQAKAEADAQIEAARGRAESTRMEAEALRANPEVLRQREIERWKGLCPLNTHTCIIGAGSVPQVATE